MDNPFAELELNPRKRFWNKVKCLSCGRAGTLYGEGLVISLPYEPEWPMMVCICGQETPLMEV